MNGDEIINRLMEVTEREDPFRVTIFNINLAKPYGGTVRIKTFDIKRITGRFNLFLPRIHGVIQQDIDGTTIKVKMRLSVLAIAFVCLFCVGIGIRSLFYWIKGGPVEIFGFIPIVIIYIVTIEFFKYESSRTKSKQDCNNDDRAEQLHPQEGYLILTLFYFLVCL